MMYSLLYSRTLSSSLYHESWLGLLLIFVLIITYVHLHYTTILSTAFITKFDKTFTVDSIKILLVLPKCHFPVMLALCLMFLISYCAQNYAGPGIVGSGNK